jgi:hypothetical protein
MAFLRPSFFAAAFALAAACGNSSSNAPSGPHYHYVVNKVLVPTKTGDAQKYGLDLDGNGNPDNALGNLLSALATQGINAQTSIDTAVLDGSITLLADLQTSDFNNAGTAGIQVYLGSDAMPPACNSGETVTCGSGATATCTGCGHDLTGTGMFQIAADSPMNPALTGPIVGGTLKAGPGDVALQISIGGGAPVEIDLIGARAQASGMSPTALGDQASPDAGGVIIGGGISQNDLDMKVIPAVVPIITGVLATHCPGAMPGACNCDSTGNTVLGLFDANHDCMVTAAEISSSSFGMTLLAPDVTIDGTPALSVGVKAFGVGGQFTIAGETLGM